MKDNIVIIFIITVLGLGFIPKKHEVTVEEFKKFVQESGYITDAEKIGITQYITEVVKTNNGFEAHSTLLKRNWRDYSNEKNPVVYVSYNDAIAYCDWSGKKLYTKKNWLKEFSHLPVGHIDSDHLVPASNPRGNAWDILADSVWDDTQGVWRQEMIGGSFLCSPNSCNGFKLNKTQLIDRCASSNHIGFSVY